jgi:23S rRNA (cytidine1920-2'-O)/16S rRNA (cytidine1409-2'-O)-methyltransferase
LPKTRVDVLMVERALAETREKAQALIMAGEVSVGGRPATKPGHQVDAEAEITVKAPLPFVSRGGFKLRHALDTFGLDVSGLVVADVGASTGGFTDCLLQRGAARVYAIDVGKGQLDWRLRQDPRVIVLDDTNVRYLEALPESADAVVVDVSFISLRLVLPVVARLLRPGGWVVALVKPQFEAGRARVGKGGVVRDPAVHREVLASILGWAPTIGLGPLTAVASPIRGPAGNVEFLIHLALGTVGKPEEDLLEVSLASVPPA